MAAVQASITVAHVLLGVYVCFKGVCAVKGRGGGGGGGEQKKEEEGKYER